MPYTNAAEKLATAHNVELLFGSSPVLLRSVIAKLDGPALFTGLMRIGRDQERRDKIINVLCWRKSRLSTVANINTSS